MIGWSSGQGHHLREGGLWFGSFGCGQLAVAFGRVPCALDILKITVSLCPAGSDLAQTYPVKRNYFFVIFVLFERAGGD